MLEQQARPAAPRAIDSPASPAPAPRLASLDAFRGLTIAAMLLVNNPGTWDHVYWPLEHAEWNGWTPTDLVFPFFLFIVGVAITFSLGSRLERGAPRPALFRKALLRAAIIFALGVLLHGFPHYDLAHLRIFGVLQRIALAYLLASGVVLLTGVRGQAATLGALLIGYWTLLTVVPVPGVGHGVLEPERNLANWLDLHVIGTNHVWQDTRTWDPEGILSTLGAVASVLCGVLAGYWIRSARSPRGKVAGLLYVGVVALLIGEAWGHAFPINKSLWTGSYVLLSAGIAGLLLAAAYWLVDVKGYRGWTWPFLVFGTNAIAAYWLSSAFAIVLDWILVPGGGDGEALTLRTYLYETLYARWLPPVDASLAYAITYVVLWLGLMSVLYRRRIFIRI
ncbi:MAG TPA: heparan-alpha-glucosaminide N-acetyltransferase domain-containing protein [Candidatus Bathyarchaeia archaeon]|nr:heparan-alpha-glucosaminide N-acetyltransferase domain-containing protein [Candidatus Bathyarchaeia archaeon]